jgi:hypothetical protein
MEWGHWDFKTNPQAGDDADLPLFLLGYTGETEEGHFVDVSIGVLFPITPEVMEKIRDAIEDFFHKKIDRILKEYLGGR